MKPIYLFILILLFVIIGLSPNLSNDYGLDDYLYLDQIQGIETLADLPDLWGRHFSIVDYRPVASLIFALENIIFDGMNGHISHGINLLLYLLCVIVFYFFTQQIYRLHHFPLIATAIFAFMPLHTSLVGNVKNRDGLLSFLFGLTAYYLLLLVRKQKKVAKQLLLLGSAVLLFYLSIFSKLDGIMFIVALPLMFLFNFKVSFKFNAKLLRQILRLSIFLLITYRLAFFLFDFWTDSKDQVVAHLPEAEKTDPLIFTENPIIAYDGWGYQIAYMIQTVFEYLTLMIKPTGHYFYYGYDTLAVLPLSDPIILTKGLILILLTVSGIYFLKKHPVYSFGVFFMFLTLSYCANLMQPIAGIIADRYAFISSAGASIAMAYALVHLVNYISKKRSWKWSTEQVSIGLLLLLVFFYLPFNYVRSKDWENIYTIIEADLPHLKETSYEANRIAMVTYIEGGFDATNPGVRYKFLNKGVEYANAALNIYQDNFLSHEGLALAHYGLGNIEQAKEQALATIAQFDTTLETSYRILYDIYSKDNQLDSVKWALYHLDKARPGDDFIILKYAEVAFSIGDVEEARRFCDSIIAHDDHKAVAYQARAYTYFYANDSMRGALDAERAFELGVRDEMLFNATGLYLKPRDIQRAERLWKLYKE